MAPKKALKKGVELSPREVEDVALGMALREFVRSTPAGQWLWSRLNHGMKEIALEAMLRPTEGVTHDFYRGRVHELTQVVADVNAVVRRARELQKKADGGEEDARIELSDQEAAEMGIGAGFGSSSVGLGRSYDFGEDD